MKILFITTWYPRRDNPTSGVFVKELARAVSQYDEVTVLYSYPEKGLNKLYTVHEEKEESRKVVHVAYKSLPIVSYILYVYATIQAYRTLRKEFSPHVIHAHVYKAGIAAVILGKFYRIPVVITEHAEIVDTYRKGLAQKIKNIFSIVLARSAMNNADFLVLVSQSLKDHLESLGIKNRTEVIPNIVDTAIFHPRNKRAQGQKKRLLFVGGLTPVKGLPYLIEAAGIIKKNRDDFVLDVVGEGSSGKEYEGLTEKLGVLDVVKFHGRKSKEEVAEYMRDCDFFVLPSIYETFGVVLIEAMACGKPVISTSSGGQKEFVNEKNGILVPPKDPEALAKAMEHMLDHYPEYDPMEIADYARKHFTHEVVGRRLHEVYKEVAG